jgi:hypothetical protein
MLKRIQEDRRKKKEYNRRSYDGSQVDDDHGLDQTGGDGHPLPRR